MKDKIFHIKSVDPRYSFVQDARCKHCNYFFRRPGNDQRTFFRSFCSKLRKDVGPDWFACNDYICNSKYVLVNQIVQLNLFDYG